MISFLAMGLVFVGAVILAASLFTTRRLITRLTQSRVRSQWYVMLALIVIFLLSYLGYAWVFWHCHTRLLDLIVPCVFFLGACFVWLTANLSLKTALDVMRISHLEQESITDSLTGIPNRRYLDRRLNEEVTRAHRHGLPLSVLMLDIDHFKQVNDRHGHPAGDHLLVSFANLVKTQLREPDILARYGGEEFTVIAPQTHRQGAIDVAERIRVHLESNSFSLTSVQNEVQEIFLTCSIGVASLGGELDSAEMLIRSADKNLFRAKREGRNQTNADQMGLHESPSD